MKEDTGANSEGVGGPSLQFFGVTRGVQVVDFGSNGADTGLHITRGDEADEAALGRTVEGEGCSGVPGGAQGDEASNDADHSSDRTMARGVGVADKHTFFAILSILLGPEADPHLAYCPWIFP